MKKLISTIFVFAALAAALFAVPVAYNETSEENWTDLSYDYIPVYKVLESPDAFVVIYQKGKYGVGQTTIPKKWAQGSKEAPAKLKVRNLGSGSLKPYLSVVKQGGEFKSVIMTMPASRSNSAWGIIGKGVSVDTDKDSLEQLQEQSK